MSNQIVVLKNTNKGLVIDTVYDQSDSLFINHQTTTKIEMPNEPFEVNTNPPGKDGWDILLIGATIIGVIAAFWAAYSAYKQLLQQDEDQLKQLAELKGQTNQLIKQNQLFEKRIRMMVKPLIWTNGGGYQGKDKTVRIEINNRGEICFVDKIEVLKGEEFQEPNINTWSKSITLGKDGRIQVYGDLLNSDTHPKDAVFQILVHYHDKEFYKYQAYIEWKGGDTELIKTIELEKDE